MSAAAKSTKHIETLIAEGGSISVATLGCVGCVAAATDGSNCLAMLVRREGETLPALLQRLNKAIGLA